MIQTLSPSLTETDPGVSRDGARVLPPALLPPSPSRFDDMDIPDHLLIDIALRHIHLRGTCTIHGLAGLMKISVEIAEAIFRRLNDQQFLEVRRMEGEDYVFSLSAAGRRLASERSLSLRYAGPAPVSLKSWAAMVRGQAIESSVTPRQLRDAFSDIVVTPDLLDALGPALISQKAIFLYGPSGTGKTTISERLIRVFEDTILVPWAVEVDGQIITLADPAVHEPVHFDNLDLDPRWIVCRRPFLAVGGELVTGMLDLQKDEATGTYNAPLQMKANNGILLIDDFGRQMMSPRDLLNRWIVPLDRRVDFLSLGSGKFDVPFELLVVFSTNLEPRELADEAFLRRIPNKILIPAADEASFDTIFHLTAAAFGMEYEPDSSAYCRELILQHSPDLRPCFPRDICSSIRAITRYEGRRLALTKEDLERAVARYFI